MSVFGAYARYYDLLYEEKNYAGEVKYVDSLIQKFSAGAESLLDIGCGTGRHLELFSQTGMNVVGLDGSAEMVSIARDKYPNLEIHRSDLCEFQLDKKFDVVTALFHVISYLTTDDALQSAFQQVKKHLKPGGLFIFDFWYGPAVLHQVPEVRIKRFEKGNTRVVRIAEPSMLSEKNRVDINFQIFINENEAWEEFEETHSMRYLFPSEIEETLSLSGLELLHKEEWQTGRKPSKDTWNVAFVTRES